MRLLKRSAQSPVDEHLTYFTPAEASEFRRIVARSFAVAGRDVDVYPDRVEDRGGTTLALWNIGVLCAGSDARAWPELIDDHVRLVTTPTRDLAELSQEELEASLYVRLVETACVPDTDSLGYARAVVPGLLEVLSVDLGDAVAMPELEALRERGAIAGLITRGRENLRALLFDGSVRAEPMGERARGQFTSVTGESRFTASLALLMRETVEHLTGEFDWGRGVLVAVPSRRRLLYRPIDVSDARLALELMLREALLGFYSDPGRLSPDVYWVRKDEWTQVTSSAGGKPHVLRGTGIREALKSF